MKNLPNHRKIMYALKRGYGERVVLHRLLPGDTKDVTTGKTVRRFKAYEFRKAPILPNNMDRVFVYDLDWIQAGRNFTKGGFFDRNARKVVLDGRDLPKNFSPDLNDFIVIRGQRFMVKKIEELERLSAFLLTISTVENQAREKWVMFKTCIDFDASASA